MLLFMNKEN